MRRAKLHSGIQVLVVDDNYEHAAGIKGIASLDGGFDVGSAVTDKENTVQTMTTIYHQEYNIPLIIAVLILIIVICIFSEEGRKKIFRKLKKELKK